MIQNIVIGKLLVEPESLFALDKEDWENVEKPITMFTEERFLPKLMVKTGVVPAEESQQYELEYMTYIHNYYELMRGF